MDDFITYYLRDLARNLTELIVVCNGKLSKQGRAAFEEFTDQIIVRENKGLDVWAYKTALDHYGWRLGTGFLSTPLILDVLQEIDMDAAYRLLENEEMPGMALYAEGGSQHDLGVLGGYQRPGGY